MQRHGWTLLFHAGVVEQLGKLHAAAQLAQCNDPTGFAGNANVKLFRALSQLIMDVVPSDPARAEFRQGNTLGPAYRHWRRAKIGRRFRLFFRYDASAKLIVYAWVNDEQTLRSASSKSDPYAVFEKMLGRAGPSGLVPKLRGNRRETGSDGGRPDRLRPDAGTAPRQPRPSC